MLRITTQETGEVVRLLLEGRLSGPWVAELETCVVALRRDLDERRLVLDLSGLTGTDLAGRYLLALLQRDGIALTNTPPLADLAQAGSAAPQGESL